jgi:hypothetical protein
LTRGAVLLTAAAAALAGCGGGSSDSGSHAPPPKPKESIHAFAGRLSSAIEAGRQGSCGELRELSKTSAMRLNCNARARRAFAGFRVTAAAAYGTGGIVEFIDAETKYPQLAPGQKPSRAGVRGIYTVALDPDGKYAFTGPVSPILPGPTIGTRAASAAGADAVARQFVDAVRRRDCALFYRVALTPGKLQAAACAGTLRRDYAAVTGALKKHPEARAVRQGGTADLTFYGLRTGGDYRTLVILKNAPGERQPYLAMGTLKGPSS